MCTKQTIMVDTLIAMPDEVSSWSVKGGVGPIELLLERVVKHNGW